MTKRSFSLSVKQLKSGFIVLFAIVRKEDPEFLECPRLVGLGGLDGDIESGRNGLVAVSFGQKAQNFHLSGAEVGAFPGSERRGILCVLAKGLRRHFGIDVNAASGDNSVTAALSVIYLIPAILILIVTSRYLTGEGAAMGGFGA